MAAVRASPTTSALCWQRGKKSARTCDSRSNEAETWPMSGTEFFFSPPRPMICDNLMSARLCSGVL